MSRRCPGCGELQKFTSQGRFFLELLEISVILSTFLTDDRFRSRDIAGLCRFIEILAAGGTPSLRP